jgi:hypothetical protein
MLSDRSLHLIERMPMLKKPVRIIVFTTDVGCRSCPDMVALGRKLKDHFDRMIALETYDVVMDRDKARLYNIKLTPTIIVQGGDGQWIAFSGYVEDRMLDVLLMTIAEMSETRVRFPDNIRGALHHLSRDVNIRVFMEAGCAQCRPVAETAIGLALTSSLVSVDVIDAGDYPDLVKKFGIDELPTTIFGENLQMKGHVTEGQFIEMVFQAEGIKPGRDKRCLICGKPTPDVICASCKTRIEAEAKDHKLKSEKMRRPETL